jgi:hypothetical protein
MPVEPLDDQLRIGDAFPVDLDEGQLAFRRLARIGNRLDPVVESELGERHLDLQAKRARVTQAETRRKDREQDHDNGTRVRRPAMRAPLATDLRPAKRALLATRPIPLALTEP